MDGTFLNFGYDTEFFMESRSSRRITIKNVDNVWGRFSDLGAAFHSLYRESSLQQALHKIAVTQGYVTFDAELFPSLTHVGENGTIRFNVVPYSSSRVGSIGSLVLFRAHIMSSEFRWLASPTLIADIIDDINTNARWHYFANEQHAVSSRTFVLCIGDFIHDITDPAAITAAGGFIASRKRSSHAKAFYRRMDRARVLMQKYLDGLANNWLSFLHDDQIIDPYVEGVILRFCIDNKLYEAKGTSERFNKDKKRIWHIREQLNKIRKNIKMRELCRIAVSDHLILSSGMFNNIIVDIVRDAEIHPLEKFKDMSSSRAINFAQSYQMNTNSCAAIDLFERQGYDLDVDTARKNSQALQRVLCMLTRFSQGGDACAAPYYQLISKYCATPEYQYQSTDGDRVLIWVGRAQPWHKGHTAMIKTGLHACDNFGFNKLVIIPVRGIQSQTSVNNPLNLAQQHACMRHSLKMLDDERIKILDPIRSAAPYEILIALRLNKMKLAGWLAGEDRCNKYADALFVMDKHTVGVRMGGVPCVLDTFGRPNVKFILTERILSGTKVRNAALIMQFDEWFTFTTGYRPISTDNLDAYNNAYNVIRAHNRMN